MIEEKEKVPAETRWTIATQAMTGVTIAHMKALLDILGEERFYEMEKQIWMEMGKGIKHIAEVFELTGDDAKSVQLIFHFISVVAMGPEMKIEFFELTPERAVTRATECPYWNRQKELGIMLDCPVLDESYTRSIANIFNPRLTDCVTKALPRGDSYCEFLMELQK